MGRRLGIVFCVVAAVLGVAVAGAAQPVKINKTRADHREYGFASTGCETGVVGPGGVIYETSCHYGTPLVRLIKFQVVAPRPTPINLSGVLTAESCKRCRIEAKLVLLVDGKRVRTAPITVRADKPTEFPTKRLAHLAKGKHMVELSTQAVEEEGLSGLKVYASELTAATP